MLEKSFLLIDVGENLPNKKNRVLVYKRLNHFVYVVRSGDINHLSFNYSVWLKQVLEQSAEVPQLSIF